MKQNLLLILVLCNVLTTFFGCSGNGLPSAEATAAPDCTVSLPPSTAEESAEAAAELTMAFTPASPPSLDDQYRNWYEVFVYSFADGDGDGIGDLPGLTDKLDYIAALGCDGIWLMPIMPSPSYHKYDVCDYMDVDPQYGTLEDLRALLSAAHERGIRLIIDLPVNHSSSLHPWFLSASEGPESPYREYYNWSDTPKNGYGKNEGGYYECRFSDSMPDLNLDCPALREELREILRFWLAEVVVDGFRLDAVTSYYTGQADRNVEFLDWLGETARAFAPDCYLVGEVWENLPLIARYAEGGIDSCFLFPVAQGSGMIARVLSNTAKRPGAEFGESVMELEKTLPSATVPAPFLENHDTARAASFLGRSSPEKLKMAGGLLALLRGSVFLYYGQEIGMVGSGDDPNKRIGMLWTADGETLSPPPGTTKLDYAFPSVREQMADSASILNYYKNALSLRNRWPEIARGKSELLPCEDDRLCLIRRSWENRAVLLAVNPSQSLCTLSLEDVAGDTPVLLDQLNAGDQVVTLDGQSLTLPAYSIALLSAGTD